MIYLIFPLEFIQTALFSAFLSLFCWDDQSVTAGKKCQHCPAGQGNLNALVLSDIQTHGVAFLYQHAWQKLHFPYLLPLCYLCYPATPSSGAQVWVCLWERRTTILPFLVNLGMELQQLLWKSLRDISKQLFFWHWAHTFLEAQLFLQSESSTSPHLLWAAFRCQRWRLALQENSSTVNFSDIWASNTNCCCPWKPNRNHHMGVISVLYATHYPTGPPASKMPHPKPLLNARSCWKAQKQLWHTSIYIYTYTCICLLTWIYTYKYI